MQIFVTDEDIPGVKVIVTQREKAITVEILDGKECGTILMIPPSLLKGASRSLINDSVGEMFGKDVLPGWAPELRGMVKGIVYRVLKMLSGCEE